MLNKLKKLQQQAEKHSDKLDLAKQKLAKQGEKHADKIDAGKAKAKKLAADQQEEGSQFNQAKDKAQGLAAKLTKKS